MQVDYSTDRVGLSSVLHDETRTGRERPWRINKVYSNNIADLLHTTANYRLESRVRDCATYVVFARGSDGVYRLKSANFCRWRLCPMCQWRRSLRVAAQMRRVCDDVAADHKMIMVTLTVPNCNASDLSRTLDGMQEAYRRMMMYAPVERVIKGYYRACELKWSDATQSEHPHYHCIWCVSKDYATAGNDYITTDQLRAWWTRALMGVGITSEYPLQVDIRAIQARDDGNDIGHAVAEVAKYSVKSDEMVTGDRERDIDRLLWLMDATANRRMIALAGCMRDAHKRLNLSPIDGDLDLVHIGDDAVPDDVTLGTASEVSYIWCSGYNNYYRLNP